MAKRGAKHRNRKAGLSGGKYPRFWGVHAVSAALANDNRQVRWIKGTRGAIDALEVDIPAHVPMSYCEVADLARFVSGDSPHQGLVIEVEPLEDPGLPATLDNANGRPLLLLDQLTDPHNIGAIFRSAAAFNVAAIITQDRHAPPELGVIAKAACGALDIVPWVRVVNLSRALDDIADAGYWRIGMDGEADTMLADALDSRNIALIMGAEGDGMRHNVMNHCDMIAKLPISGAMESLNVSNAAAIALYALDQQRR